jgi:hypothetical protein
MFVCFDRHGFFGTSLISVSVSDLRLQVNAEIHKVMRAHYSFRLYNLNETSNFRQLSVQFSLCYTRTDGRTEGLSYLMGCT